MNFISLCSGIEAASVAFEPLGWTAIAFSEIDRFANSVLAHHYPETPNLGDITNFRSWPDHIFASAGVIVGGPPCQAFSVAGLRGGLSDARGNLTITYTELIDHADRIRLLHGKPPVICIYENVPGLLSDKTGAFGCFLAGLAGEDEPLEPPGEKWTDAGCVFGPQRAVAWRCLDAQYFGLAQRRKRVFVIASAREGFDPTKVLFEFDGLRRDSAPSREAAKVVAGTLASRTGAGGLPGTDESLSGYLQPAQIAKPLTANLQRLDFDTETFVVHPIAALAENSRAEVRLEGGDGQIVGALSTGGGKPGQGMPTIAGSSGVRRLLPVECEFLQGFPRDYTAITIKGKPAADSPRYKALGNSMAVSCMHWIGKRISQHLNNKGEN